MGSRSRSRSPLLATLRATPLLVALCLAGRALSGDPPPGANAAATAAPAPLTPGTVPDRDWRIVNRYAFLLASDDPSMRYRRPGDLPERLGATADYPALVAAGKVWVAGTFTRIQDVVSGGPAGPMARFEAAFAPVAAKATKRIDGAVQKAELRRALGACIDVLASAERDARTSERELEALIRHSRAVAVQHQRQGANADFGAGILGAPFDRIHVVLGRTLGNLGALAADLASLKGRMAPFAAATGLLDDIDLEVAIWSNTWNSLIKADAEALRTDVAAQARHLTGDSYYDDCLCPVDGKKGYHLSTAAHPDAYLSLLPNHENRTSAVRSTRAAPGIWYLRRASAGAFTIESADGRRLVGATDGTATLGAQGTSGDASLWRCVSFPAPGQMRIFNVQHGMLASLEVEEVAVPQGTVILPPDVHPAALRAARVTPNQLWKLTEATSKIGP